MTDDVTRATVEQMARDLDREPEMSMNVTVDLTAVPPRVVVSPYPSADDPEAVWFCEVWPNATNGGECISFMANSPAELGLMGQAICRAALEAVQAQREG